jgi:flagellar biosynthesis protein FlhB
MKLSEVELILVVLVIVYVAFFTHPIPHFIASMFKSPVGHALALGAILYVTVYESLVVGIFLAIAYVMTTTQVTEYMENKPEPKVEPKQPESSGVAKPVAKSMLEKMMKGDMRLPSESQKKGTEVKKMPEVSVPKGSHTKSLETFASF